MMFTLPDNRRNVTDLPRINNINRFGATASRCRHDFRQPLPLRPLSDRFSPFFFFFAADAAAMPSRSCRHAAMPFRAASRHVIC